MIDSAAGESIAAPSPCPARAAKKTAALPASADTSDDDGEHAETGQEDTPATEEVRGAAAEQQQAAEDQRVARDRPAQVSAGDPQLRREIRKRDVHGRDVEDDHQLRERQHEKEAPPRRSSDVGCCSCRPC